VGGKAARLTAARPPFSSAHLLGGAPLSLLANWPTGAAVVAAHQTGRRQTAAQNSGPPTRDRVWGRICWATPNLRPLRPTTKSRGRKNVANYWPRLHVCLSLPRPNAAKMQPKAAQCCTAAEDQLDLRARLLSGR